MSGHDASTASGAEGTATPASVAAAGAAPLATWIDGERSDRLALPDRGLEFGDGLYETMAVVGARVRLLERHLARLTRGCVRLGLSPPQAATLAAELDAAARVPGAAILKLVLTRGRGGTGYATAERGGCTRIVSASTARPRPAAWWHDGVAVRWCELRLAEQPALAGMKHLNRLEQVLARREWSDPATAEGLMLDVHGRVVCGTMTNVFAVLDGVAVTPRVDRCGVAGVMREALLESLPRAGVRVEQRDLERAELEGATEVFLTNALVGVWPVRALGARTWSPGPVARLAQSLVTEW